MQIRLYTPDLLPTVLELLRRSDSTPRTPETWEGNGMSALLAFEGDRAVGLIPLQPREFKISAGCYVNALWVSGAHVDMPYRSKGLGAAMDAKIVTFYPQAQAVFAYRQDEDSRAYQWYMKMGYKPMSLIFSFKKEVPVQVKDVDYKIYTTKKDIEGRGEQMLTLFNELAGKSGGYPRRSVSFWGHTWGFHYYRDFYQYALLTIEEQGQLLAYAFVGETSIRDEVKRLDILELASPIQTGVFQRIIDVIIDYAQHKKLQELRIQCAALDPLKEKIASMGFTLRWQTNILGKELKPGSLKQADTPNWKYFQIDYI